MKKVLFIEDDPDQVFLYREVFGIKGIDLKSAESGKRAMKMITEDKPDLILLDILLENENGLETLKELKRNENTKKIPVIVFTNYKGKETKEEALKIGARDFIIKSQTVPEEMAAVVLRAMGTR
ncbi:MAG: response regulator [Patescibacteria group bacterium]|nr:response regulator [Patescibacteria group bacterium]